MSLYLRQQMLGADKKQKKGNAPKKGVPGKDNQRVTSLEEECHPTMKRTSLEEECPPTAKRTSLKGECHPAA